MEQTTNVVTITPDMAQEWLKHNVNNRKFRQSRAELYASELAAGRWRFSGDSIKFSKNGTIIDGQHRLAACVQSGVSFKTVVVCGLDDEVFNVVDRNLGRSANDVLDHHEIKYATTAAAAARLAIAYESGNVVNTHAFGPLTTPDLILAEVRDHRQSYERACHLGRRSRLCGFNPSGFAAFVVLADRRFGSSVVDDFIESVLTGANLGDGDPRIALRNQILGPARPKGQLGCLALMIRTWNAWSRGKTRRQIKGWTRGMPFPQFDDAG